jgi:hypothetical protein
MIAACEHARLSKAELNRINVFPVPDGDTGTNLALTVSSVADELRRNGDNGVDDVARAAAEAGVLGARGNCGMILSHWLIGISESLKGRKRVTVADLKGALRAAADHIYASLEKPVEGTMLTVMRETAEEAEECTSTDLVDFHRRILARAREALARTPDLLPPLEKAGVVDAGAKGFVEWLEGIGALIEGDPLLATAEAPEFGEAEPVVSAEFPAGEGTFRFCTEALVRGEPLPEEPVVRSALRDFGDSLIVIRSGTLLKVHVHTDDPEGVFDYLRGLGRLESHKAEDMAAQHRAVGSGTGLARRPVTIVTDSACDLPEAMIRAHGIHVVPLSLVYQDRVLRDRIDIDADTFVERLREGDHPSTSQPPPGAFHDAYLRAAEDGEEVLAVILAGVLSGTLGSARAAAAQLVDDCPVHVVDSRGISLLQGLLVLKAAELAELGWEPDRIRHELDRVRDQSGVFLTVDTFDRLIASGRVSRGRAWLGSLLDIKPILNVDRLGAAQPVSKVRGHNALVPKVLDLIAEKIGEAEKVRFGVVHVDAAEAAEEIRSALLERFGEREILTAPATPVIATHIGPNAWGLAYMVEDE